MINTVLFAGGLTAAILVDAYGLCCGAITLFLNKQIGIQMGLIGTGFALIFFAYWTSKVSGGGFFKNKKLLKKFLYSSTGEIIASGLPIWIPFVVTTSIKNWGTNSTVIMKDVTEEETEEIFPGEDFDEPHAEVDLEENTEEEGAEEEEIDDEAEEESGPEEE